MAQEFRHIKVTPADDEVVILAGKKPSAEETVADAASKPAGSASSEGVFEARNAVANAEASGNAGKPSAKSAAKEAYHPTTLEDIESSKMPKTQVVVIIVAVVALVAFGIWFFALS